MEYAVMCDDVEVKRFTNKVDAENFRKSVAGAIKCIEVKEVECTTEEATQ